MNCKVCGTRLGILERWRYGDFCSEDHKTVFADDLESLNRQLTNEAVPLPGKSPAGKAAPEKPAAKDSKSAKVTPSEIAGEPAALTEPEAEPEPAMAGFVKQPDASPQRPPRPEETEVKSPVERGEKPGELWRLLAKRAEQETIPAPARANAGSQERPVIMVAASPEPHQQAPGGYFLASAYPTHTPPGQVLSQGGRMPQGTLTPAGENFWGPSFAVSVPVVPAQPKHWVGEEGWHWISDESAQMVPSVENVLASYPMAAPWTHWPLMAPGAGGQQRVPMGPPLGAGAIPQMAPGPAGSPCVQPAGGMRSAGMPQAVPDGAIPGGAIPGGAVSQRTGPPPAGPFPGGIGPGGIGPGGMGPGGMMPGQIMPEPVIPAGMLPGNFGPGGVGFGPQGMGGVPGVTGGVFGGGQVMGWGASQPFAPAMLPQGGPGYQWRELPPPFFSALVDLSFGVDPLAGRIAFAEPAVRAEVWPNREPGCPNHQWTLGAEIVATPQESLETSVCTRTIPDTANFAAPSRWTATAVSLPSAPGLPRPRIPRRAAPPVLLPLAGRLGLSRPAEPMRSTGSGFTGARGA